MLLHHKIKKTRFHTGPFSIINLIRRRPTFPGPHGPSIIGPGGLNFRVRNGNGCIPSGIATGNFFVQSQIITLNINKFQTLNCKMSICHPKSKINGGGEQPGTDDLSMRPLSPADLRDGYKIPLKNLLFHFLERRRNRAFTNLKNKKIWWR